MLAHCTCKHEFQDTTYGTGNRVHNLTKDGKTARCTVCQKKYTVKKDEKKDGTK